MKGSLDRERTLALVVCGLLAYSLLACSNPNVTRSSERRSPSVNSVNPVERPSAFLGLRTAICVVPDLTQAKAWYAEVLEVAPYFDQPFYVGFNVGGYELGLMPAESELKPGPGGVVAYWGVVDADAAWTRLLEKGAQPAVPVQEVGEGIKTAVVKDPFGNLLGIIENPHFPKQP